MGIDITYVINNFRVWFFMPNDVNDKFLSVLDTTLLLTILFLIKGAISCVAKF